MLQKLRDYFFTGIIVILPAALTLWLLAIIYKTVNESVLTPLMKYFKPYLSHVYLEYVAKTAIFLALLTIVVLVGMATRIIFIRKLFSSGERIFFKIPMFGKIYITMKQMSKAFLGERKGVFKAAVLIEYPRKGVYSIGFLTSKGKGEIQHKTKKKIVNVFMPTTPNPTSGILLLTPEDELLHLDMSVEEAMKLVMSGGMVAPDYLPEK
ncbi:MAG: DUF502 domain-containing protein [Candidatus Omnitrophota bacterium]|nr:DUF502 domain-containing protein [Candidatus Omnitrophota bacterium]